MKILWKRHDRDYLRWYEGVCWSNRMQAHAADTVTTTILGLNLILRCARAFLLWLRWPIRIFDAMYRWGYWRDRAWEAESLATDLWVVLLEEAPHLEARIKNPGSHVAYVKTKLDALRGTHRGSAGSR